MKSCLILSLIVVAFGLGPPAVAAEHRPNVVFIIIDNVDYAYLGKCYGGNGLTPHLDRIAGRGVKFTRAYAVTPLCVPSRYTCLSGRYASRARETQPADDGDEESGVGHIALEANLPNLPDVLRRAGYATGFVGKYHLENSTFLGARFSSPRRTLPPCRCRARSMGWPFLAAAKAANS